MTVDKRNSSLTNTSADQKEKKGELNYFLVLSKFDT